MNNTKRTGLEEEQQHPYKMIHQKQTNHMTVWGKVKTTCLETFVTYV